MIVICNNLLKAFSKYKNSFKKENKGNFIGKRYTKSNYGKKNKYNFSSQKNGKNSGVFKKGYKNKKNFFPKKGFFRKYKKGKFERFISSRNLRVYDSIVFRRLKILKRIRNLDSEATSLIFSRVPSLTWSINERLVRGLNRYRSYLLSTESRGLKRKIIRRRKTVFAVALLDKQKLKLYYGILSEFVFKKYVSLALRSKYNQMSVFVSALESRLASFLFRTNFFPTVRRVQECIRRGYVLVNGKPMCSLNYELVPGDVVSFEKEFFKIFISKRRSFFKKRLCLFFYPSSYMEFSLVTFSFLFYKKPILNEVPFLFNVNLVRVLAFYNRLGFR